jgi:protein-tyrosine-phosphatase
MQMYIFACVHNAGRSQMSAAFFNQFADPRKAHAISAGTTPGDCVHPEVVEVMREVGIDLAFAKPQKLTAQLAAGAAMLVTMGCGDECPYEEVRIVRNEIRNRVLALIAAEGLGKA